MISTTSTRLRLSAAMSRHKKIIPHTTFHRRHSSQGGFGAHICIAKVLLPGSPCGSRGVRLLLSQPQLYVETNINGTMNLLELAQQHGVRQFVFGSSSSVYGVNEKVPFSETDPIFNPISPYAATKAAGELLRHTYSHLYGLRCVCLRFFTGMVHGNDRFSDSQICAID